MPRKALFIGSLLIALIAGLLFGRFTASSSTESPEEHVHETAGSEANSQATIWTCSMHPQIQQSEAGQCPICGMDLIPLVNNSDNNDGPRTLSMSESSRALAAIETTAVRRAFPTASISLVGKLDYDETSIKSLTARFPARIDELFVNYTGVSVRTGEHLARIYSPELLTAQRELLTAHATNPDSTITLIAREKLRLWDLLPEQIDAIIDGGQPVDDFELRAPVGGVVVAKNVKEGDYVKTGEPLFKIVDLSKLWLHLDAYESDLAWLRYGQEVSFTVESLPGETFKGRIAFIAPEVNRQTRTVPVRVNVMNTDNRLKPGMFARGEVQVRMGNGGTVYTPEFAGKWISPMHPEIVKDAPGACDVCGMALVPAEDLGYVGISSDEAPVIVPSSAVLRTGKRAVVYVENPLSERPSFEGREIVLGVRAGAYFLVKSGLTVGERVVTQGAFKIDSALQIQAKPSMMNPKGGGPVPGHNHGGSSPQKTSDDPHAGHQAQAMVKISGDLLAQLIPPYLEMQAALASDDLEATKTAIRAMMEQTGHAGDIPDLLHTMLGADSLDALRKPHFDLLSQYLIAAAKAAPTALTGELKVMHCPMVYEDRGADWLQATEPLQNPYFGAAMLKCGEIKETLTTTEITPTSHAR